MDNALVIALWLISVFMLVISVHNMLRERRLTRQRREIEKSFSGGGYFDGTIDPPSAARAMRQSMLDRVGGDENLVPPESDLAFILDVAAKETGPVAAYGRPGHLVLVTTRGAECRCGWRGPDPDAHLGEVLTDGDV